MSIAGLTNSYITASKPAVSGIPNAKANHLNADMVTPPVGQSQGLLAPPRLDFQIRLQRVYSGWAPASHRYHRYRHNPSVAVLLAVHSVGAKSMMEGCLAGLVHRYLVVGRLDYSAVSMVDYSAVTEGRQTEVVAMGHSAG